jgi:hypothetical protein
VTATDLRDVPRNLPLIPGMVVTAEIRRTHDRVTFFIR